MTTFDRLALALDALGGCRSARLVLSDMLAEAGEQGLADWVKRKRWHGTDSRNLGLMLLPTRSALRMGCRFVADGLYEGAAERNQRERALFPLLQWSEGRIVPRDVERYRRRLTFVLPLAKHVGGDWVSSESTRLRALAREALELLLLATELVAEAGQPVDGHFWLPAVNKLVCKVAEVPRRWYAEKVKYRKPRQPFDVLQEQHFQLVAHYRSLLPELHPWPK